MKLPKNPNDPVFSFFCEIAWMLCKILFFPIVLFVRGVNWWIDKFYDPRNCP